LQTIGKVPRLLLNNDNLDSRQKFARAEYQDLLHRWIDEEFKSPYSIKRVLEFLEDAVFKKVFASKYCTRSACDHGLVCFGEEGIMYPINGIAAKVLLEKWAKLSKFKKLSQYRDLKERGVAFERQICRTLIILNKITFSQRRSL
jgi:hypothetical protein